MLYLLFFKVDQKMSARNIHIQQTIKNFEKTDFRIILSSFFGKKVGSAVA